MSETQQPPPPPPPAAPNPPSPPAPVDKKKGIGAFAWIAIGCAAILLLGGLLSFACTAMLAKKAKNFVEETSENPAMSAAEMVVRLNPDLELVEKDEAAGTMTIYDKSKDARVTLNLDDVMAGKFGVETEGGEAMNIDFGRREDGSFGATVTDEKGETSEVSIGAGGVTVGDNAELPDWLPGYKDVEVASPFTMKTGTTHRGTAAFTTPDPIEAVAAAMTRDLEAEGFEVDRSSHEAAGVTSILLDCKSAGGRQVTVSLNTRSGATYVAMNFSDSV